MSERLPDISSSFSTLVELLRYRAVHTPEKPIYTFLLDGEIEAVSITYRELDERARAIAALLQQQQLAGKCSLLLYPASIEYIEAFFGCLYANVIAVPAYPPRRNHLSSRINTLVEDCQASAILTTTTLKPNIEAWYASTSEAKTMRLLTTDAVSLDMKDVWKEPILSSNSLAFLQYTSGSTAAPKGVILTHGNLLHNLALVYQYFDHTGDSRALIWLPPYHDMGLIGGILQPLYGNFPVWLMSPIAFLQRPLRWLQAISNFKITASGGPNFAYDLCVRKILPEQCSNLDLSSWNVAFNGAELIRQDTLERFVSAFGPHGFHLEAFHTCYGLAEATLIVSCGRVGVPPVVKAFDERSLQHKKRAIEVLEGQTQTQSLVGCGQSVLGQKLAIVHPEALTACSPGQVGEVWVSSPSIALGYWNKPKETEYTFQAYIPETREGPFLRTGDLGFLMEGELFITGRLKDLIIIRGYNHYPQDIEQTVGHSHSALRPNSGAAFAIEVNGEERLMIVHEVERQYRQLDVKGIADAIRQAVAIQHDIKVYGIVFLRPGSIPKTSSGKIQRHACKSKFLEGTLQSIGSSILEGDDQVKSNVNFNPKSILSAEPEKRRQLIESFVQGQIAYILRLHPEHVDLQQSLSTMGFDSLSTIELKNNIEQAFNVNMPMLSSFQELSTAQVASELLTQLTFPLSHSAKQPLLLQTPVEYSLSHGQQALWFLHQLAPTSGAYNIARAAYIHTKLNVAALQRSLQVLVERHSSLQVFFSTLSDKPVQYIRDQARVCFQQMSILNWSEQTLYDTLIKEANRPFDLNNEPLLRIILFTRSECEHVLLFNIHHIVADLWSMAIILRELGLLYNAEQANEQISLPGLDIHYAEFVQWQQKMLTSPIGEKHWLYWQQQLMGELPVLSLPTDRSRPLVMSYHGDIYSFRLHRKTTQLLKSLALSQGATLFTILLAVFQLLLYRYTGQEDILVGSPMAGRTQSTLNQVVGYFVNPVVLRSRLSRNISFIELLKQVRQTVLAALDHQDYPFPLLVERLQPERDPGHSPLFQVMLAYQKAPLESDNVLTAFALDESGLQVNLGKLQLETIALERKIAQFDLSLVITEAQGELTLSFEYNVDLFNSSTIIRMAKHFEQLVESTLVHPEQHLCDYSLLLEEEQQQLIVTWNNTKTDYPNHQCIHQLFEKQVTQTPNAIAISYDGGQLTYQELNKRSNKLAHYLQRVGIGPEVRVGICLDRSFNLMIGLLGILKAGGAYVPLDPAYPQERLLFMIEDAKIQFLITQQRLRSEFSQFGHQVCLDTDWETIDREDEVIPRSGMLAENIAYVIYTSGSTGRPKGVLVPHQALVNHSTALSAFYGLKYHDRVLQFSSISFDVAAEELFPCWLSGACVVLHPHILLSARDFSRFIENERLTILNLPTSYWYEWISYLSSSNLNLPSALRLVIVGSERTLPAHLTKWKKLAGDKVRWCNAYGPTEATITTTIYEPENNDEKNLMSSVPIGRPIANTCVYVLDKYLCPVPIGVSGELYIGGVNLARGYLGQPALTAERFIPNPFSDASDRLYKTGDLVRYLPDGTLEFLGRIDQQIKIRGYRVELEEIEVALNHHPAIRQALVLFHSNTSENYQLVAYFVPQEAQILSTSELRSFLKKQLPEYMIPSVFLPLQEFPLTSNNKVDRQALPLPTHSNQVLEMIHEPPKTKLEQTIAEIWQEALNIEAVGINDNFFDLGGHSLLIVRVHAELQKKLQKEITIIDFFQNPTVKLLAEYINQECKEIIAFQEIYEQAEKQKLAIGRRKKLQQRRKE